MFLASIKDGKIEFSTPVARARFVEWAKKHESAYITIEERKKVRTLSQNSYYWVYLGIIAEETGELADDLHEYFKRKLLPPVFKKIQGEEIKLPRSTTELGKLEFGEYLDKIAALTDVPLPDPQEAGYLPH